VDRLARAVVDECSTPLVRYTSPCRYSRVVPEPITFCRGMPYISCDTTRTKSRPSGTESRISTLIVPLNGSLTSLLLPSEDV
jgi:hypothetical protein